MNVDMMVQRNARDRPFMDGGWGWAVMVASFLSQALIGSIYFGYGILLPEWMEEFQTSSALTSLIGSTVAGVISGSGPIVSLIILKTSCRTTHVLGGFLIALSTVGCSFANSMMQIFVLYSILVGFGGGMCYISSVIILSQYFKTRRSIAVGVAASGVGFGSFVCPIIYEYLINYYGWRGVMLITGAINGNMVVFGIIMRSVKQATSSRTSKRSLSGEVDSKRNMVTTDINHNIQHAEDMKSLKVAEKNDITEEEQRRRNVSGWMQAWIRNPLARRKSSLDRMLFHEIPKKFNRIPETITEEDKDFDDRQLLQNLPNSQKKKSYGRQLFKLMGNPFFYILIFHNLTMFFGMMIAYGLTPLRAVADYSMTAHEGALLVSITGLSNLLGRLIWGAAASSKRVDATILFLSLRTMAGVLTLASPLAKSFPLNAMYCALVGLAFGNWSIYPVVVGDQFGDSLMTVAFGYLETANGIGGIIGPLIGGCLYDMTGTYQYSFIASGVSLLAGVAPFIILLAVKKISRNRQKNLPDVASVS